MRLLDTDKDQILLEGRGVEDLQPGQCFEMFWVDANDVERARADFLDQIPTLASGTNQSLAVIRQR
jgi:hypothetical protein